MSNFTKDKYGVLGQIQPDGTIEGGDSACWMGHYVYLTEDKDKFPYIEFFERSFGAYTRHPDPESTPHGYGCYIKQPWGGCISRDQLTGILAAVIRKRNYWAMVRIIIHSLAWLGLFSYNTINTGTNLPPEKAPWRLPDLTIFNMWAMMIRGLPDIIRILLWPVLLIYDIQLIVDALFSRYDKSDDQINFAARLFIAKEFGYTPTAAIAIMITDKDKLNNDLKSYWCNWRQNCGMYELFKKRVDSL